MAIQRIGVIDGSDGLNPPVRACVGAPLFRPGLLVEIRVTAAR